MKYIQQYTLKPMYWTHTSTSRHTIQADSLLLLVGSVETSKAVTRRNFLKWIATDTRKQQQPNCTHIIIKRRQMTYTCVMLRINWEVCFFAIITLVIYIISNCNDISILLLVNANSFNSNKSSIKKFKQKSNVTVCGMGYGLQSKTSSHFIVVSSYSFLPLP